MPYEYRLCFGLHYFFDLEAFVSFEPVVRFVFCFLLVGFDFLVIFPPLEVKLLLLIVKGSCILLYTFVFSVTNLAITSYATTGCMPLFNELSKVRFNKSGISVLSQGCNCV